MSYSIQGVLLPSMDLQAWRPNDTVRAQVWSRLEAMAAEQDDDDAREFLAECMPAIDFVCGTGQYPGRTWVGAFVTWHTLQVIGSAVHSNSFNPISPAGAQATSDDLLAAGSPVGLFDTVPRGGPWELSEGDAVFFGGWDKTTLQAIVAATNSAPQDSRSFVQLFALRQWAERAIAQDLTLWAWLA